jgi:hypothetical protein
MKGILATAVLVPLVWGAGVLVLCGRGQATVVAPKTQVIFAESLSPVWGETLMIRLWHPSAAKPC